MEERDEKRGGAGVAIGLVLFAFLLVVYLLSIGPAYRITGFQLNVFQSPSFSSPGQRICEIVYWPICRAATILSS